MINSYNNQIDLKLQSDVLVNDWRAKRKELGRPPSESGLSLKSAKSEKSYASSRISLKERKRQIEEAKLEMQALKEKQELQRELEETEKGKAELSRKLELLDAKTKVQRTEMELMLEQSVEEETDGMNDYLQRRLCRVCLAEGHRVKECTKGFTCRKAGCGRDHHYLIHCDEGNSNRNGTRPTDSNVSPSADGSGVAERSVRDRCSPLMSTTVRVNPATPPVLNEFTAASPSDPVTVGAVRASRPRVCFKVVPVKITGNRGTKEITTHAFLDSGSDATFCLESLVQDLELKDMKPTSYMMTTVNCKEERTGHEVQLNMEFLEGDVKFRLEHALTTNSLPVTPKHMATNEEIRGWPHFHASFICIWR